MIYQLIPYSFIRFTNVYMSCVNVSLITNRDNSKATTTSKPPTDSGSNNGNSGQSGSNPENPTTGDGSGTGGGQDGGNNQGPKAQPVVAPEKIYLFAIGKDWKPFEYL